MKKATLLLFLSCFNSAWANEATQTTLPLEFNIPDNAPFDGLIGSNFYMNNLIYFNFDRHLIYVKKN